MKNKSLKLGIMPTRRKSFAHAECIEYKTKIYEKVWQLAPAIEIADLEWLNEEGLLKNMDDAFKAAEYFKKQEVDCLFIPHCNFGTEDGVAYVAKAIGKPVLLWGPRDNAPSDDGMRFRDTQCGLFATSKVLQRYGVKFTYIINSHLDTPVFEKGFLNFLCAADGVRAFMNARIGQLSTRPRDFCSVIVNEGELLERFGTQVVPWEVACLADDVRKKIANPDDTVRALAADMEKRADFTCASKDLSLRLAALEQGIWDWAEREGLDAVAVQCWDLLQKELGICSCYIHGSMTEKGLPLSCETDIHGALTSLLLQGCTHFELPTFLADLTIRHPANDNAELLWHCGPFPATFAIDKFSVGKHYLLPNEEEGVAYGEMKRGALTVTRFDGIHGKYSLLCGEGKAVEGPFNKGTYVYMEVPDWPLWEEKFIYGPYIHHLAGTYGSWSTALYEAARYIDGLEFDAVQPDEAQIRKSLRG